MHELLLHVLSLLTHTPTPSPSPTGSGLLSSLVPSPSPTSILHQTGGGSGDSSSTDSSVKVAVVTAIGVVFAAAITALASTFQRGDRGVRTANPTNDNFTRDYINSLVRDRRELQRLRVQYNELRDTHTHLREGVLEHQLDPDDLINDQIQRNAGGHP